VTYGPVRYAKNGDTCIAYRVWGDAGPTLVTVLGWVVGTLDDMTDPTSPYAQILELFSPHFRVVGWDRPGTGLSDPLTQVPSIDDRVDDLRAVIDAAGVDRPVLFAAGEGGPVAIQFAVTYPERVQSMMLMVTAARLSQHLPDFPWGFTEAEIDAQLSEIDDHWGEGVLAELFVGEAAELPGVREDFGRRQRSTSSRRMARMLWQEAMQIDVRHLLSEVRVPTAVLPAAIGWFHLMPRPQWPTPFPVLFSGPSRPESTTASTSAM
jgi:pimeloyl-ACP methyl ester carboxylesterase